MSEIAAKPRVTFYLYLVTLFTYLFCHIDLGVLASSNEAAKKYLGDISESDIGLVASALYIGNIIGSLVCPSLFANMKAKHILVISAVMNGLCCGIFVLVSNYWIVFASRVLVGFFEVMFIIYIPVWIDTHAPPSSQTMWISFFFLTVPLGLILGYGAAVFLSGQDEEKFRYAFLLQTLLMIVPVAVAFVLFPSHYFDKPNEEGAHGIDTSAPLVEVVDVDKQAQRTSSGALEALKNSAHQQQKKKTIVVATFSIIEKQPLPVMTVMKNLFLNPSYMLSVLAITNVMFILTALQYRVSSYGELVLKGDPNLIFLSFTITVLTAPCIGAVIGGIVCTKALGSYTNPKALGLCFIVYCLFMGFCIPAAFVNDYLIFIGLVWGALFMQGFIEPIMMGIILNTVTPIERPTASSLSILIEFVVGIMPAPYLYGIIIDAYPEYITNEKQ